MGLHVYDNRTPGDVKTLVDEPLSGEPVCVRIAALGQDYQAARLSEMIQKGPDGGEFLLFDFEAAPPQDPMLPRIETVGVEIVRKQVDDG